MKIEAYCTNDECVTNGSLQLIPVHKLSYMSGIPLDEDGNWIDCQYCGGKVVLAKLSRDTAQFPLGSVVLSQGARKLFSFGKSNPSSVDVAEAAAPFVARHVSGDHGDITGEVAENNQGYMSKIISRYVHYNQIFLVITSRDRSMTRVILPEELRDASDL